MGLEAAIRAVLFSHLALIFLVARQAASRTGSQEAKVAVMRHSAIFWLLSMVAVVLSMALSALVLVAIYTRIAVYMRDAVMWGVVLGVASVVTLASAVVLRGRLSKVGR